MASQLANHLRALYSAKKKDKLRALCIAASHHRIPSPQTGTQRAFLLGAGRLASDVPSLSSPSSAPPTQAPESTITSSAPSSSSNSNELSKFTGTWWDYEGPWKQMHLLNPPRLAFICSTLCRHFGRDPSSARPFEGLKFVDVGCGGGIVSEPLARMGAAVTGVDIEEKYIESARDHADLDPSTSTIEYCWATAEMLVEEQRTFDAVISLQVVEYAADPAEFCKSLAMLAVPNGAVVIATTNRSMATYVTAVISATANPNWAPPTPFSSLLTPEELALILKRASVSVKEMAGYVYKASTGRWALSDDISGNFIAFGTKNSQ